MASSAPMDAQSPSKKRPIDDIVDATGGVDVASKRGSLSSNADAMADSSPGPSPSRSISAPLPSSSAASPADLKRHDSAPVPSSSSGSELVPTNRKRHAEDHAGAPNCKRRRMGQASVLCMRELIRAIVSDGDIKDQDRIILQNVAMLLSQVDGQTWVNFADNHGGLNELTPQQLRKIRPFLENVAKELKSDQVEMLSKGSDNVEHLECMKLVSVPWSEGISARELLACCEPDEALQYRGKFGLVDVVTRVLPTKYMLRSRVRELVNHYYIKHWKPTGTDVPKDRPSLLQRGEHSTFICIRRAAGGIRTCARRTGSVLSAVRTGLLGCVKLCRAVALSLIHSVSALIFAFAGLLVQGASKISSYLPTSDEPVWPALRLFCTAFLCGQAKKFFDLLIMIARLRVILCLATCNKVLGWIFWPFVFIAQKLLQWRPDSVILGCSCHGSVNPPVASWLPVRASEGLVLGISYLQYIPMLEFVTEPIADWAYYLQPAITFLLDLLFSIGIAEGLAMVINHADEQAQAKFLWMSMSVGRMMREGGNFAVADAQTSAALPGNTSGDLKGALGNTDTQDVVEVDLSVWKEDGDWNLFD